MNLDITEKNSNEQLRKVAVHVGKPVLESYYLSPLGPIDEEKMIEGLWYVFVEGKYITGYTGQYVLIVDGVQYVRLSAISDYKGNCVDLGLDGGIFSEPIAGYRKYGEGQMESKVLFIAGWIEKEPSLHWQWGFYVVNEVLKSGSKSDVSRKCVKPKDLFSELEGYNKEYIWRQEIKLIENGDFSFLAGLGIKKCSSMIPVEIG